MCRIFYVELQEGMMNIAFVTATKIHSGAKPWMLDMAHSAICHGHKSIIYSRDIRFVEACVRKNVPTHLVTFGMDYNPVKIVYYIKEFLKHKITHCVINISKEQTQAGIAARILGIPVLRHIGDVNDMKNKRSRKIEHFLVKPTFVCCSQYVKQGFQDCIPFANERNTYVIIPGVTLPEKNAIQVKNDIPVIIMCCRLVAPKAVDVVINACALLAEKNISFEFKILGEGSEKANLQDLVQKKKLVNQVKFLGFVSDVYSELVQADIFVMASYKEGLGIALQEAMTAGLICVGRHSGGVPEIWPEAALELLLPIESTVEDFARVLEEIIDSSEEKKKAYKQLFREHVDVSFNQEKQFKQLESLLEQI